MTVPHKLMQQVYDQACTPYKLGIVLRAQADQELVDCPSVFRHAGRWYMMYVALTDAKTGYQTYLAASDNLLTWTPLGCILPFRREGWDAWQADGGIALQTCAWGGSYELAAHDNKYWASYIGGALKGYEPDPLSIGLAWTLDPAAPNPWTRLAANPVLGPAQTDVRDFEVRTAYKSNIVRDPSRSTGHDFLMAYNGKAQNGTERIGLAVSDDMVTWRRFGHGPVIDNARGISGDPQLVRFTDPDVWVMFYFGAFWKKKGDAEAQTQTQSDKPPADVRSSQSLCASVSGPVVRDDTKAFDTFACSLDLTNWTKWTGPHLIAPSEPFDATFAHKPWVIKHDGVVYHFYCAVGDQGRHIALATSSPLR